MAETQDISREYMLGATGGLLSHMLYHSCPASEPDEDGYSEHNIELHCVSYVIWAKFIGDDDDPLYDVRAVYFEG